MPNVKIEIENGADFEIVIRCDKDSKKAQQLKEQIEKLISNDNLISLRNSEKECFIDSSDIMYFESSCSQTYAHTEDCIYLCDMHLYELSDILPSRFIRISKSTILNMDYIKSMKRNLSGICEIELINSNKKVYVSRMFYKPFKALLNERLVNNYEK